jgi:hypothetical protein
MSRIFLSSSKDNFAAIALRDWLASEGWSDVFLDLDPERGSGNGITGQAIPLSFAALVSRAFAVVGARS